MKRAPIYLPTLNHEAREFDSHTAASRWLVSQGFSFSDFESETSTVQIYKSDSGSEATLVPVPGNPTWVARIYI